MLISNTIELRVIHKRRHQAEEEWGNKSEKLGWFSKHTGKIHNKPPLGLFIK